MQILAAESGACEERVEGVLIEEEEWVIRPACGDHRATWIDPPLQAFKLCEEAPPELAGRHHEATVHIRLPAQLTEAQQVSPTHVVSVVKDVRYCQEAVG